jgi:hypothetical protein
MRISHLGRGSRIIHFTVNTQYSSYCKWDHAKCLAGIIFKKALKAIYNKMHVNDWIVTADSIKAVLQLHKTSILFTSADILYSHCQHTYYSQLTEKGKLLKITTW